MNKGFVKNHKLLEEHSKVTDLLDFGNICSGFIKKLNSIPSSSIIALVGPFGSGKSTMLNRVMLERKDVDKWIEFDAWKYPDRKDLWEGFILDFAKEISPKDFKETDKKLKGKQNDDKKALVNTISKLPGLAALGSLNHFFEASPAKRVDEIQKILKEQINKAGKELFIIVEDIDRSGDAGVFFLETLKQFMRTADLNRKVVIVVPIANENYHKNIDSYLKCIDYFELFRPEELHLGTFVDEIFDNKLFEGEFHREDNKALIWSGEYRKSQTISFLEQLFDSRPETTMRLLKLIIRKADLIFKNQVNDGFEPDFRVTLCLEASKYFKIDDNSDKFYFDDFKKRGLVAKGNIFSSFLMAMLSNTKMLYQLENTNNGVKKHLIQSPLDFNFIERKNDDIKSCPSFPWNYNQHFNDEGYGIASFYSKY